MELSPVTDDGVTLAVTLHEPDTAPPHACVVALHAAAYGTREHDVYEHLRRTLTGAGVAVVLYDRRGSGGSDGAGEASLGRLAEDARTLVHAVAELPQIVEHRVGLWGISQGGWIGPIAAAADEGVAFVIAVSASGVSPSEQMHFAMDNVLRENSFTESDIAAARQARILIESRYRARDVEGARSAVEAAQREPWYPFAYLPSVEDVEQPDPFEIDLNPIDVFSDVRVPTLAIYGEWDRWVPIDRSIEVWGKAFADRPELLTVERIAHVGHMMTMPEDRLDPMEAGPVSSEYAAAMHRWITDLVGA